MRIRARAIAAAALATTFLFTGWRASAAESTTGTILGTVRALGGAPIAGAAVSAASPSGQYRAVTGGQGSFAILGVTPDSYVVTVQAPGFAPFARRGVAVLAGRRARIEAKLQPELATIAAVTTAPRAFATGSTSDTFTVSGQAARGITPAASSSGLATYAAGTVQGTVAAVPGIALDPFANAILRGGKVDDAVFEFDSVPIPQGLIAEPGGNVVGAQLPTTGIASTTVALAGFETQGDNALGGVIDEIPAVGTYPATTRLDLADGISGPQTQLANLQALWATPDGRRRYALAATTGTEYFAYGDGRSFYPSEAATYGLALQRRSQFSAEGNARVRISPTDEIALLGFAGQAAYDQYDSPYAGETIGALDGAATAYPGQTNPAAPVTFATGVRGTFDVLKAAWSHTGARSLSRVQIYQSQFGASAGGPYWDENGFPNGAFSYVGQQSGRVDGIAFDGDRLAGERHDLRFGAEYRLTTYSLDQVVPTFDQTVRSKPLLHAFLAYAGDSWSATKRLDVLGALRLTGTRLAPSTGFDYSVGALDPHLATTYQFGRGVAARATFDHTTVAPKPLEADRNDSANVDANGNPAPFVPLNPETGNEFTASLEGSGRTQFRLTYFIQSERNRIDVLPFNFRQAVAGEVAPSPIGIPTNAGELDARGFEAWLHRGKTTLSASTIRGASSSASQFAYNNLNAPAIAAGHVFPLGYVPDLNATLSYEFDIRRGRVRIEPSLSYESGYPYGVGTTAWIFDPTTHRPERVPNDNHVDPGASYYFLANPALPFDAATNPYIGNLGTSEGPDPNTLRSPPQTLANLHVEADLSPRVTALFDVVNAFGNVAPTAYQANPYLIGPPGYAGGNALYAAAYRSAIGGAQPYLLGNGVPTNDGVTQVVPWTYGRAGYVPQSYPSARAVRLRLRYRW